MEYVIPVLMGYKPHEDIDLAMREHGEVCYHLATLPEGDPRRADLLARLVALAAPAAWEEAAGALATGASKGLSFADALGAALAEVLPAVSRYDARSHVPIWDWVRPAMRRAVNDAAIAASGLTKGEAEDVAAVRRVQDGGDLTVAEIASQLGWPTTRVDRAIEAAVVTYPERFGDVHDADLDGDDGRAEGDIPARHDQIDDSGLAVGVVTEQILARLNAAEEGLGNTLGTFFGIRIAETGEGGEPIRLPLGEPRPGESPEERLRRALKWARAMAHTLE